MIKAIVFDCFGVLVHGSFGYIRNMLPPDRHEEIKDLNRSADYGYISFEEYVQGIADVSGKSVEEIYEIIRSKRIRDENMIAYVRHVKNKGYKTAMLSNIARDVVEGLFPAEELQELFDTVVLSGYLGMVKPNAEIYEHTLAKLGVQPQEAVMVDDLEVNVDGARRVGMEAVQFATREQLENELGRLGVS